MNGAMRLGSSLVLLVIVLVCAQGCGARTGFDADDVSLGAAAGADADVPGDGVTSEEGVFCAFNVGRVASCRVPASDGRVQRCAAPFVHCVDIGGTWGCCSAVSNNNGPGGSCRFTVPGVCE